MSEGKRQAQVGDWACSLDGASYFGPFATEAEMLEEARARWADENGPADDDEEFPGEIEVARIVRVFDLGDLVKLVAPWNGEVLWNLAEDLRVEELGIEAEEDVITATKEQWAELAGKLRAAATQWAREHDIRIDWWDIGPTSRRRLSNAEGST